MSRKTQIAEKPCPASCGARHRFLDSKHRENGIAVLERSGRDITNGQPGGRCGGKQVLKHQHTGVVARIEGAGGGGNHRSVHGHTGGKRSATDGTTGHAAEMEQIRTGCNSDGVGCGERDPSAHTFDDRAKVKVVSTGYGLLGGMSGQSRRAGRRHRRSGGQGTTGAAGAARVTRATRATWSAGMTAALVTHDNMIGLLQAAIFIDSNGDHPPFIGRTHGPPCQYMIEDRKMTAVKSVAMQGNAKRT